MAREQMLLDRIASLGDVGQGRIEATAKEDIDALMQSVQRNLTRLFNARHGMSEALPDYGLPALADLTIGTKDYVTRVREAIKLAITKYEPRLRRVRVGRIEDEESGHTLGFRIDAKLVSQSGEHGVWYETRVAGSGAFEVSE